MQYAKFAPSPFFYLPCRDRYSCKCNFYLVHIALLNAPPPPKQKRSVAVGRPLTTKESKRAPLPLGERCLSIMARPFVKPL